MYFNLYYTYNCQWWCVCQVISSQWKSWATYPLLVGRRGINRWGDEDISRFIHIHVGLMCQAAIAAYKSVELDEHLGGSPIQHREVQGQESARFQAYFKKGVRYLSGGAKVNSSSHIFFTILKIFRLGWATMCQTCLQSCSMSRARGSQLLDSCSISPGLRWTEGTVMSLMFPSTERFWFGEERTLTGHTNNSLPLHI